jgi:hypothetical protein
MSARAGLTIRDGSMERVLERAGNRIISSNLYNRGFGEIGHRFLTMDRVWDPARPAPLAPAGTNQGEPDRCTYLVRLLCTSSRAIR